MDRQRLLNSEPVATGKRLYKEMSEDDVLGVAAELAFKFFMAIFPFFIFVAALGGFASDMFNTDNPVDDVMTIFGDQLPPETEAVLRDELNNVIGNRDPTLLSLGVVGALWAAAGGIGTIMKATNRAYGVKETRKVYVRYGLAVGLTACAGMLIIAAFIIFVAGQVAGLELADELGLEGFTARAVTYARWPAVGIITLTATSFLYWLTPNKQLPWKWITPGAVVFVIGWLVVSYGFALYVDRFGSYNATYGTLGGVVITLTWFYLTSLMLLLGAELNAVLAEEAGDLPEATVKQATPEPGMEPGSVDSTTVETGSQTPRTGFSI